MYEIIIKKINILIITVRILSLDSIAYAGDFKWGLDRNVVGDKMEELAYNKILYCVS